MTPSDPPPSFHAFSDEDTRWQTMLRETVPTHLADGGFSDRIMRKLPTRRRRSGRRRLILSIAGLGGTTATFLLGGPSLRSSLFEALRWSAHPMPGAGDFLTIGAVLGLLSILASGLWAHIQSRR